MPMPDQHRKLLRLCTCAIKARDSSDPEAFPLAMAEITAQLTPETLRLLIMQAERGERLDDVKRALGIYAI